MQRVPDAVPLPSADAAASAVVAERAAFAVAEPVVPAEAPGAESARLGYAISSYPDVEDTMARLRALVDQPVRGLRHDALNDVLEWFETKCQGSKQLTDRAKSRIPGGVQHNLAFNHPFPLAIDRADGAHLTDRDGNVYIDFLQAGGPTLLGSNYAPVQREGRRGGARVRARSPGSSTSTSSSSPSRSTATCRTSRCTARSGRAPRPSWPPSGPRGRSPATRSSSRSAAPTTAGPTRWSTACACPGTYRMNAKGIPFGATSATREAFPHDLGALRRKLIENRVRGGTAAVVLEPLGPESGTRPVPEDFNARVRELCDEFGALLVFDEVVTGFRVGMGGAAGYFGVTPDLTVLGKAVSGGYPMAGGVGGREDVMAVLRLRPRRQERRARAGRRHPVGQPAVLRGRLLRHRGDGAHQRPRRRGPRRRPARRRPAAARRRSTRLPYVVYNQGSIVHLECSGVMLLDMHNPVKLFKENKPRKQLMEQMGAAYTANGIITLAGSRIYTSMADTDAVIDDALERFDRVFSMVDGV